jgi:hypothetical protein
MLWAALRRLRNAGLSAFFLVVFTTLPGCSESTTPAASTETAKAVVPLWGDAPNQRPSCVRGIHLTAWYVGTKKGREKIEKLFAETDINTAVIDIKETEGDVYIPGVSLDGKPNYVAAMRDIKNYLAFLKARGIFTIARIVVFHDNKVAKQNPEWAIHSSTPIPLATANGYRSDVWVDRHGSAWADPTNEKVWDYNIHILEKAAELGFQGVQFDYIRFPSDGPTRLCVYAKPHTKATAVDALEQFLERAHKRAKELGVELSIDVFGLTGSSGNDMGIGQKLSNLIKHVDVISPMMYPSHYAPGEFGIKSPNASPYETIHQSIRDTKKVLGESDVQLRPYLQDFSLGVKYGVKEVQSQIAAAGDLGIHEWLMWNPACRYTQEAFQLNETTIAVVNKIRK